MIMNGSLQAAQGNYVGQNAQLESKTPTLLEVATQDIVSVISQVYEANLALQGIKARALGDNPETSCGTNPLNAPAPLPGTGQALDAALSRLRAEVSILLSVTSQLSRIA